jgi:hypothetical protein
MKKIIHLAMLLILIASIPGVAAAQSWQQEKRCPVDTRDPSDPEHKQRGVWVCGDRHDGGIGFSFTHKEFKHFVKYPFGRSQRSVPKDIEGGVRHVGRQLKKKLGLKW